MKKITIIGLGLTGTLLAILLGRRGQPVQIFEKNRDPRMESNKSGKSVNLTLCKRGIDVLQKAGLGEEIEKLWVPAYGRYLHIGESQAEIQPYGNHNEALYSISRQKLNLALLDAAMKTPNISIAFNKKCIQYNLTQSTITLENADRLREEAPFELLIAADGIYSTIRNQMQRNFGFNYSQVYSHHINKELSISSDKAKEHRLMQNYIHIWPRNEFMIIAFPNPNGSFTCTLQLPAKDDNISFEKINTASELMDCFNKLFPDAITLIPNLVDEFFQNPGIPMMTVRCSPWFIADKVLLIGDAAHGIWPSYGQGANAGFEDCRVLDECLTKYPQDTLTAFSEFQRKRKVNVDVVADLSESHFNEIRHLVSDKNFLLKKKIERRINLLFPTEYFSTYSRIAFTTMPYEQAVSMESYYNQIVNKLLAFPEVISQPDSPEVDGLIYHIMNQFKEGVLV